MAIYGSQIKNLITDTFRAGSILIPGKGWFLFGGNSLKTSQKLKNLHSNWEAGPAVQTPRIQGQCVVQVLKKRFHIYWQNF
jgi:hypothetical protein